MIGLANRWKDITIIIIIIVIIIIITTLDNFRHAIKVIIIVLF